MNELTQSKDGYIVFDESGTCALAYGAAEKWFKTYDEAINYALEKVTKNCELFKERIDFNSVIVYEGSEEFMHGTHTIPYEKVLFWWKNHKQFGEVKTMKHQKEWCTCDRCGAEINENERSMFLEKVYRISGLLVRKYDYEKINAFDLCPKCRKDFEEFMRNDR